MNFLASLRTFVSITVTLVVCFGAGVSPCWTHADEQLSLSDKTLVAWVQPANLTQRGSGVLSVMEGDAFDSIVLGEVREGVWMPGSEHFNRTETNREQWPRDRVCEMVGVAIIYRGNTIELYRDGT